MPRKRTSYSPIQPRTAVVKVAVVLAIVSGTAALSGCAGAGATFFGAGATAAATAGVSHTLNGIAYKTFTTPVAELERATRSALDHMGMTVYRVEDLEKGRKLFAKAETREIEIEFERIAEKSSRMRVTVFQDMPLLRDSATATEIIIQTAATVGHGSGFVDSGSNKPTAN